jgi:hypothetical protein
MTDTSGVGYENIDRSSEELRAWEPEHPLDLLVDKDDVAVGVDHDRAVGSGLQQGQRVELGGDTVGFVASVRGEHRGETSDRALAAIGTKVPRVLDAGPCSADGQETNIGL